MADVSAAITLEQTVKANSPLSSTQVTTLELPAWGPQADELILVAVALRHPDRKVTVTGHGLTFVEIANVDNVVRNSGVHLFRAMGSSTPAAGSITVSCFDLENNPYHTDFAVLAARFSGVDSGGTDGSSAVEATATDPGPANDNDDMKVDITTVSDNAWTFAAGSYRTKRFEDGELPAS